MHGCRCVCLHVHLHMLIFFLKLVHHSDDNDYHPTDDVTRASDGFADGLWHTLKIEVTDKKVNCTVDRNVKVSNRELAITPGSTYYIGKSDLK